MSGRDRWWRMAGEVGWYHAKEKDCSQRYNRKKVGV